MFLPSEEESQITEDEIKHHGASYRSKPAEIHSYNLYSEKHIIIIHQDHSLVQNLLLYLKHQNSQLSDLEHIL